MLRLYSYKDLMMGELGLLHEVVRFSHHRMVRKETVAEHTSTVLMYAYFIAKDLMSHDIVVDLVKVLTGALLHDIDEVVTGDIMYPFKHSDERIELLIQETGNKLLWEVLHKICPTDTGTLWKEFNWRHEGLEGQIIKLADVASVLTWAWREVTFGNMHAFKLVDECMPAFRKLKADEPELKAIQDTIYDVFKREFGRMI